MKTTIGPMLCKLNTEHASIPELAERKAAAETAAETAAEAAAKAAAHKEREEAQRKKEAEAAVRAESVHAPKKKRTSILAEFLGDTWSWLCEEHRGFLVWAALVLLYALFRIPALWNPATCTENATSVLISGLKNPFMPALGHDYVVPVCETCGKHHDGDEDHYWDCADCTTPVTCSRCGAENTGSFYDRVRHQWVDTTDGKKICKLCGARILAWEMEVKGGTDERTLFMLELESPWAEQTRIGFRVNAAAPPGDWTVYVKSAEGDCHAVGTITVVADPDFDDGRAIERDYIVTFSEPLSVRGVGIEVDGTFPDDSYAADYIGYICACQ